MYSSSDKLHPINLYKQSHPDPSLDDDDEAMIIEVVPQQHQHQHQHQHHHHNRQLILADSSGGEDLEVKAPKKRAETWIQEEIRSLIGFRKDVDRVFNTSKSNKHLWEQISLKMKEKGFDRSPTMCTDKWRNLLKEFKKVRHHRERGSVGGGNGGGLGKMSYYKELEELLRNRSSKSSSIAKHDSYIQFSDKGLEDANIPFGSVEASGRSTVNLERRLEHDTDPLALTSGDAVAASGLPPWNWRETPENGPDNHSSYGGRVVSIKLGEYIKRIGIDGTADAIKEAIKSAFGLRTKRAFWLEDEDGVVRCLDRDMPLGNYTLHLDEGVTIKVCLYDGSDRITVRTQEKTLYTENDFHDFLTRHGLMGLRELTGYRSIETLDELHSGALYQGVRLLGD